MYNFHGLSTTHIEKNPWYPIDSQDILIFMA